MHTVPPRVYRFPHQFTTAVAINESAEFRCTAIGTPTPVFHWLRDERALDIDAGGRAVVTQENTEERILSILRIENVTYEDRGNYSCVASNRVGEKKARYQLDVLGKHACPARSISPMLCTHILVQSMDIVHCLP